MWYIYTMESYSAIKKNEFESVVVRWMNLETVIQCEVSQKEENKYSMLTYIYGLQKNGIDGPICKMDIETQIQRTNIWTPRGEKEWDELGNWD